MINEEQLFCLIGIHNGWIALHHLQPELVRFFKEKQLVEPGKSRLSDRGIMVIQYAIKKAEEVM